MLEAGSDKTKKFETFSEVLEFCEQKIGTETDKLCVEPEDIMSDALAYYKSPGFDPTIRLKIRYRKQAAVDTGGVLRQFYTDVWTNLLEGSDCLPPLFEGKERRKLPSFNSGIIMSGVIKYVGKMFAHSICQEGIGFTHLAPAAYWYMATGDATIANRYVSVEDAVSPQVQEYIEKVYKRHSKIVFMFFNSI